MPVLTKINTNVIADDAVTGDKFAGEAYLSNTATQNITGTYSENRLYTSDAYTLSGNATVNSHLTLSSVKPNSDIVLTAGGAYTLTGTGTLSGGSLLAKTRSDLTGMTGEIGGVVTGSPNLNLTSATTFPTGHVIRILQHTVRSSFSSSSTSYVATPIQADITPLSATNKILVMMNSVVDTSAANRTVTLMIYRNGVAVSDSSEGLMQMMQRNGGTRFPFSIHWLDDPQTTSSLNYRIYAKAASTFECPPYASMDQTVTFFEIVG